MKILIITTHLNIGGIASYTDNLAKTLKEKGEDVFVASSGGDLVERLEEAGVSHKRVNIKTKCEVNPKLIRVIIDLVKFVRENKIDIIHAQTRVAQVVSFFIMKFTKVPYVSTCHGFFKRRLSRCIFPAWGSRVIAISDAVRENLVNVFKVKKERIKIVYNGVDISYLEKQFPQSELDQIKNDFGFINKIVIATVARLSPVKGIGYLVDAAKLLL